MLIKDASQVLAVEDVEVDKTTTPFSNQLYRRMIFRTLGNGHCLRRSERVLSARNTLPHAM